MVLGDWVLHSPAASLFYSSFIRISLAASPFYYFACSPFIGIFHENGSTGWSAIHVLIQHSEAHLMIHLNGPQICIPLIVTDSWVLHPSKWTGLLDQLHARFGPARSGGWATPSGPHKNWCSPCREHRCSSEGGATYIIFVLFKREPSVHKDGAF